MLSLIFANTSTKDREHLKEVSHQFNKVNQNLHNLIQNQLIQEFKRIEPELSLSTKSQPSGTKLRPPTDINELINRILLYAHYEDLKLGKNQNKELLFPILNQLKSFLREDLKDYFLKNELTLNEIDSLVRFMSDDDAWIAPAIEIYIKDRIFQIDKNIINIPLKSFFNLEDQKSFKNASSLLQKHLFHSLRRICEEKKGESLILQFDLKGCRDTQLIKFNETMNQLLGVLKTSLPENLTKIEIYHPHADNAFREKMNKVSAEIEEANPHLEKMNISSENKRVG